MTNTHHERPPTRTSQKPSTSGGMNSMPDLTIREFDECDVVALVAQYLDDIDRLAATIESLYGFAIPEAQKSFIESAKYLRWGAAAIKQQSKEVS